MSQSTPNAGQAPRNYHPENIAGKTAIVSGGTTGIGRAIARLLVERGAKVLIFGRNENDLQDTLQELRQAGEAHGVSADQSKIEDVQRVFKAADEKLGSLDILVNNAAVYAGGLYDKTAEEIAYGVNVNLVGYMICAQEALARMEKNAGEGEGKVKIKGHIVNIGSLSAKAREKESSVYVATKAGIQAFSESLHKTVNEKGIKVSLVEPGLIESDLTTDDKADEEVKKMKAEGDMLEEEDIAEAVHYALTQPARCDVISIQIRPHRQPI
jgi:NADP-dependent 3-hydroxy acid dehydrogenase YdfG